MNDVGPPSLANELQRRRESFRRGYLPPEQLVIDPALRFHTEVTTELDAITFEVIRSKLWNLNLDHSDTIRRVSGSNIVVEGMDFNCAVTTEVGDAVTLSPYTMFFAGLADEDIKWTLEHRSMNVGIHDGDLFLQNDPWVGANHQMDTAVFGPVFVDGRLFAWLYNCVHQREIGGAYPGGFIQDARDVYTEPTFMPPIKLAEHGVIREDVVDMWTRRSRLPELMALELNSQVAGFHAARKRLQSLLDRYGPPAVKATMHKMIDDTAQVVASRLARLPDATWRDERYLAGANPGDLRHFRLCISLRKIGDRLTVSNHGTDPSVGSVNLTPGNFRACVLSGLLPTLAYDQYLCAAGVLRQLDFDFEVGTINCAAHPAAVSPSMGSVATMNQAHGLGSKMLSGDPLLAQHAFASSTLHTQSANAVIGLDDYGQPVGYVILDMLAGGVGAFSHRDGIDYGGSVSAIAHHFSDVEKFEGDIPFLYLYRRELPSSGGHGRWRGGVTYAAAWTGHKVDQLAISSTGFAKSVTMGIGVCGGYPATGGRQWHATDTEIRTWFDQGKIPGGPDDLRKMATHGRVVPPASENRLLPVDVFELIANPGAGWGDPLDRDLATVDHDLEAGRLTADEAEAIYGVSLDAAGRVEPHLSTEHRTERRRQRIAQARPPRRPRPGRSPVSPDHRCVVEGVAIVGDDGRTVLACSRCGQHLSSGTDTYRWGCAELEAAPTEIADLFISPRDETGQDLVIRQYLCPGCGQLLDTELCRPEDQPYTDVQLH